MSREISVETIKNVSFEAAKAAQKKILPYFRCANTIKHNKDCGGWDPVTKADQEGEKTIIAVIKSHFPDHNIIGEEFGSDDIKSDYSWIIDPIDGTRAFILGLPIWGILIGVSYKNKPFFGLMYQPHIDEFFYGDNNSAFYQKGTEIKKIHTNPLIKDIVQSHIVCTTPDMFQTTSQKKIWNVLKDNALDIRYGTDCYGFISVAMGGADILFESQLKLYDYMPLLPIIKGAGGEFDVIDKVQGMILVSANKDLHQKIMDLIMPIINNAP